MPADTPRRTPNADTPVLFLIFLSLNGQNYSLRCNFAKCPPKRHVAPRTRTRRSCFLFF